MRLLTVFANSLHASHKKMQWTDDMSVLTNYDQLEAKITNVEHM